MMDLNFASVSALINFYISLILVLFFSATKYGDKQTNRIIAVLLLAFTLLVFFSFSLSNWASLYFQSYHKPLFLVYLSSFLIGPIILKYLQLVFLDKKFIRSDFLHTIPFLGFLTYTLIYFRNIDSFIMWEHLPNYAMVSVSILIHLSIYVFFIIRVVNHGRKKLNSNEKKMFLKNRFDVYKIILTGYILLWVMSLHILAMYMFFINPMWCANTASVWGYSSFTFLNAFLIVTIVKPNILLKKEKYQHSVINADEKNKYLNIIKNYLIAQKAYLNSELSLENVSNDVNINKRIISQIINETYNTNFRNHVNTLRLEHSLKLFMSDENQGMRISEVMYDSGFSSKTVFNTMFKEKTGMTPKEFKLTKEKSS